MTKEYKEILDLLEEHSGSDGETLSWMEDGVGEYVVFFDREYFNKGEVNFYNDEVGVLYTENDQGHRSWECVDQSVVDYWTSFMEAKIQIHDHEEGFCESYSCPFCEVNLIPKEQIPVPHIETHLERWI